jgi:pyridoxal biosynthesis lyase PdxS
MTVNGTTPAARMTKRLPLLVFAAFPAAGHVGPPLYIAQVMMSKGYEVIFMASAEFKSTIEKTGAEWYECAAYGDEEFTKMRNAVPPGIERTLIDMEHAFSTSPICLLSVS